MSEFELLIALAEIAGVFVGFAALIGVRSGGATGAHELTYIRSVVWMALFVVVAALLPAVVSVYGPDGHGLWLACSVVILPLFWVLTVLNRTRPEHQTDLAATPRLVALGFAAVVLGVWTATSVALMLVVLGVVPALEPALYVSGVALILFVTAFTLLALVFSQQPHRD